MILYKNIILLSKLATWEYSDLKVLQHVRSFDPDVRVGYLDFAPKDENLDKNIKAMQDMGNGSIVWPINNLDKEKVQRVHNAGVGLCGWTASDNKTYIRAIDMGLTTITCDYKPSFQF